MDKRQVPDLLIEKLLLDELSEGQKRRLLADPEVLRRVRELERSNREILAAYPPEAMSRRIEGRLEALASAMGTSDAGESARAEGPDARPRRGAAQGPSGRRGLFGFPRLVPVAGFAVAALVTGLLLAVVLPGGFRIQPAEGGPAAEQTRLKGLKPRLVVYQRTDSGARSLRENAVVGERDALQLAYVSAARPYGVIVSLDGRGVVTQHFPSASAAAGTLEPHGETLLGFAYQLDDAPAYERFFFVTAAERFAVGTVMRAAERLAADPQRARRAPLELPEALEQVSFVVQKRQR